MNAETTPVVIAEVLSKSTSDYDYDTKLPCYKKVSTVRQIIYVSSLRHFVTVWERDHETSRWTNTDYDQPDDIVNILGHSLRLGDLYQNVFFE
jgi:Uma2 family endonuclease